MDTSTSVAFFAATLPSVATSQFLLLLVSLAATAVVLAAFGINRQD